MADIVGGRIESATGNAKPRWLVLAVKGAAVLRIALAAGCQQPEMCLQSLPDPCVQPQITVYELANRLDLDVRQVNARQAVLSNRANTVLLLLGPDGRAYVNGKPVTGSGGMWMHTDTVWVPAGVAECLEVALPLGDDQVCLLETSAKRRAAVLQDGARRIGAVVDDLHNLVQPGGLRIRQCGIIEDWGAADDQAEVRKEMDSLPPTGRRT